MADEPSMSSIYITSRCISQEGVPTKLDHIARVHLHSGQRNKGGNIYIGILIYLHVLPGCLATFLECGKGARHDGLLSSSVASFSRVIFSRLTAGIIILSPRVIYSSRVSTSPAVVFPGFCGPSTFIITYLRLTTG